MDERMLGVGWTLVGLYFFLSLISFISLIIDFWSWSYNTSPKSIKISFFGFHVYTLLFGLVRAWQVLVLLKAEDSAVIIAFNEPLNLFAILLFISAFSCIVYNGAKAAFRLSKRIVVWNRSLFGMNLLLWVFTLGVIIAFYSGFSFSEFTYKERLEGAAELLAANKPYHQLLVANLCIITFAQVFLAIACIIILAASTSIILRSGDQTKRKKRVIRIVKLSVAYGLLSVFFLVRTIVVWRSAIAHRHVRDYQYLVLELLIPDIVPALLLYTIEYFALRRKLLSSNAGSGVGKSSSAGSHSKTTPQQETVSIA